MRSHKASIVDPAGLPGCSRPGGGARWTVLLVILLVVVPGLVFGGTPSGSKADRAAKDRNSSYGAVFTRVAGAWRNGDQKTLARLVHPDGLKVIASGSPDRAVNYSSSQAFYYFRNLFQNNRTTSFTMTRIQDSPQGGRVHGLADWEYESGRQARKVRLVIVLTRHKAHWFLSEITTIR